MTEEPFVPSPGAIIPVEQPPAPRRQWVLIATVAVFGTLALLLGGGWIANLVQRNEGLNDRVAEMYDDLHASEANAQRLYDQLLELGAAPEGVDPEVVVGPAGARGEAGRPPTAAEIAQAVEAYCSSRDQCRGVAGQAGAAGSRGADGSPGANGVQGAPGTDGVPGPTGPQGPAGPQGEAGPQGPAGPTCSEGFTPQVVTLQIQNAETGELQPATASVCLPA